MAKETVMWALAKRVDRGQMDIAEVGGIAQLWFCDNPVAIYGLHGHRG